MLLVMTLTPLANSDSVATGNYLAPPRSSSASLMVTSTNPHTVEYRMSPTLERCQYIYPGLKGSLLLSIGALLTKNYPSFSKTHITELLSDKIIMQENHDVRTVLWFLDLSHFTASINSSKPVQP